MNTLKKAVQCFEKTVYIDGAILHHYHSNDKELCNITIHLHKNETEQYNQTNMTIPFPSILCFFLETDSMIQLKSPNVKANLGGATTSLSTNQRRPRVYAI